MKKLLSSVLALSMGLTCAVSFTACGKKSNGDEKIAGQVLEAVWTTYVDKYVDAETPNDYEVIGQYPIENAFYTIDWSVNVSADKVKVTAMNETTKMVTIDVNEKTSEAINYELTASVTVGKYTGSRTFTGLKVPAYKVTSNAEYWAAKDGDTLVCTGTVTAFAKKDDGASGNHIYFEDADGGYYAYNLTELPEGLEIGSEIQVTGTAKMYYGLMEITNCTVEILGKGTAVTPKDITSVVAAAADNKDEKLTAYQCQLVTIKGALLHNDVSNNTYYGFKLGKVDSYLRISGSDCPTGATNQAKIKADHVANIGKTATITGVVAQYSGVFYIVPVSGDAFKDFGDNNLTDAEKVAEAKKAVAGLIETTYTEVKNDIPLPAESWGAKLEWSVDDGKSLVSVASNKLNVLALPATEDAKVTLKVAISSGEARDTAEVEITIAAEVKITHQGTKEDPYTVKEALAIASKLGSDEWTDLLYMKGVVTNVPTEKSSSSGSKYYQNVYLADADNLSKTILAYSINLDAETNPDAPAQNDELVIYGHITNYGGHTIEFSTKDKTVYVNVLSNTRGQSTITLGDHDGATVEGLPEKATNGTKVEFNVQVDSGKQLVAVKANGATLTESEGKYSFTVAGNTSISVETSAQGETIEQAKISYSTNSTGNMTGNNDASTLLGASDNASIFNIWSEKTNNGNNHVGLNKDGTLRLYKNQTATLHISIDNAYVITKIEVTLGSSSPKGLDYLVVTVDGQSVSGTAGTYAVNKNSVSLHNSNNDSSNNQIYIESIVIYYKAV